MPKSYHVGIILDGNRRFAQKNQKPTLEGHKLGAQNVKKLILEWAPACNINQLTLYAFSMQNFQRSKEEVSYLFSLFRSFTQELLKSKEFHDRDVRIRFCGRLYLFPKPLQTIMHKLMEKTKNNTGLVVNLCMAYGGKEEIIDAVKDIVTQKIPASKIDEKLFASHLYLADEPDLIIRTGGDQRTSNFLIWQSWYSEWFFVKKTWPEFSEKDLKKIIKDFEERQRRFGK
ncbi:di-trans,poly-cis-decaprenylcistransferase [Candidatus Woesearchaeota archaeon]|nr:di-trans,poly-cis-decaprenylcistransferase [Candidatus Woesearchaeota archaeon]